MRLGLIARSDHRGLGIQTKGFFDHLNPAATVVVLMGDYTPYDAHPDEYPGAMQTVFDGKGIGDEAIEYLLDNSDVILTAETPYSYDLFDRARERGVKTVLQGNHEFFRFGVDPNLSRPDLFISPSTWEFHTWPEPKVFLPFPVDRDLCRFSPRTEAKTFLHVAGHRAHADRNGTTLVLQALRYVRTPIRMIIRTQSVLGRSAFQGKARHIDLDIQTADVPNYWNLYDDADVLVLPRRYGGQSLPMNEALSCGLPVISLDVEPQRGFLPAASLVPARVWRQLPVQSGPMNCYTADPRVIARKIDELAGDPQLVTNLSLQANRHADSISWRTLGPRYVSLFESLVAERNTAA